MQSAILRDVVALANSGGGCIYLGVSAAERRPVAGVSEPQQLIAELSRDLATQVTPPVSVETEEATSAGKPIIILSVAEGAQKPYAIAPGAIYVRRGAESVPASRDEIVQMIVGSRPSAPVPELAVTPEQPKPAARRPPRAPQEAVVAHEPAPNGSVKEPSPEAQPEPLLDVYEEAVPPDPIAPTTGVEIVDAFEQDGKRYYTLRDLRYHKLISNVTNTTERRMWRTAIAQREKGEVDEAAVRWDGDYGLLRSYRQRAGERRYDLVYRGDGDLRVFYGVSEAGMGGRWKALLTAAKAPA
jgi:hypothetical protein